MTDKNKISAVVLSGGKSSRMGTDKGLMEYKGRALILHVIETLSEFVDDIAISTNNDDYKKLGFSLIKDEYNNCGPIGGLHAALKNAKTEQVLVLSCDIPFVQGRTIEKLIKAADSANIVVAKSERGVEPTCAVYSRSIIKDLEGRISEGNFKMRKMLQENNANAIYFEDSEQFRNMNTKDDLNDSVR